MPTGSRKLRLRQCWEIWMMRLRLSSKLYITATDSRPGSAQTGPKAKCIRLSLRPKLSRLRVLLGFRECDETRNGLQFAVKLSSTQESHSRFHDLSAAVRAKMGARNPDGHLMQTAPKQERNTQALQAGIRLMGCSKDFRYPLPSRCPECGNGATGHGPYIQDRHLRP